jgi:hypothetical protein
MGGYEACKAHEQRKIRDLAAEKDFPPFDDGEENNRPNT